MIQLFLAFLAGVVTIASPCILPLLPVLLGASLGKYSKWRPVFIVGGFVIVFSGAAILISLAATHLGFNPQIIRDLGIALLVVFGLLLLWEKPFEWLAIKMTPITAGASKKVGLGNTGHVSALLLGMSLGLVWTPCAGPVLASILTLVALQQNLAQAFGLLISYSLGVGVPMLVVAYGGQFISQKVAAVSKYTPVIQKVFGVIILLLAVAMYLNLDTQLYAKFFELTAMPKPVVQETIKTEGDTAATDTPPAVELGDYGTAPEFAGGGPWLNSDPLHIADLKGKVVLVDFWTYSCINCIRTLPYLAEWNEKYKDKGLVVVGVHTPEFAFEKDMSNVAKSLKQYGITYPVVQDNAYAIWNAYHNQYWPAKYLVNQQGKIVLEHFGEGNYQETENAIRYLLGMDMMTAANPLSGPDFTSIGSPEMYFGTARLENLSSKQSPSAFVKQYSLDAGVALNKFSLDGMWKFNPAYTELISDTGKINIKFHSAKMFMVASANAQPVTLKITVDGKPQPDVTVTDSKLYTLFDSKDYTDHYIEIEVQGIGLQAFTFTFG